MMNKKIMAVVGVVALSGAATDGLLQADPVIAQETDTNIPTCVSEFMQEQKAQIDQKIEEALSEGKITQKQYDIITAMRDIMPDLGKNRGNMEDIDPNTTVGQLHEQRQQEIVSALKEKGVEVTAQELDDLRELREDLGLKGPMGRGGKGRMRANQSAE